MRTRVFFLLYSMHIGGVEKSLLGILNEIPLDRYDVCVGLIKKEGSLLDMIPRGVEIKEISDLKKNWRDFNDPPIVVVKNRIREKRYAEAIVLLFMLMVRKITGNSIFYVKSLFNTIPQLEISYDIAVAFSGPSTIIDYYISNRVTASIKCGWIHYDVSKFGIDKSIIAQLYKLYDKIFIVSEAGKKVFDWIFPQFSYKTEVFHNVVSRERVLYLANLGPYFEDPFDGKRILTVGRISEEKGQRVAIEALKILIDNGFNLRWYFVGDGKDRLYCEHLSKELGIDNCVVFLGIQSCPYGYMKDCDVYVQPSRHEGYCITLAEASCFLSPIVATDFTGAEEQLESRSNGVVVGMTPEDIAKGIMIALKMVRIKTGSYHEKSDITKLLDLR